jgi:CrcB protein
MFAVAVGGALGSVLRYLVSNTSLRWLGAEHGHYGTLIVNLIGCFSMGMIGGVFSVGPSWNERWLLFARVGILGGLTTFSAFGWETFSLFAQHRTVAGSFHLVSNVVAGLVLVWIGYQLGRWSQ